MYSITKAKVILMGDWNVDFLETTPNTTILNDIMMPSGFKNMVDFPTRVNNTS